ncbi:MAG TPA: hypothetical protein VHJ82_08435 [Actinomycetota bacterium]|nr:hypothetical protein [Actinomycetota bacterium]
MGAIFAAALPVLPGQSERVRNFGQELQAVRDEYDELNRKATLSRHILFLQPGPPDMAIHVMEGEDLTKIGREFTDSAHDQWWLDFLRDVHGVDLRGGPAPQPSQLVFDSSSG